MANISTVMCAGFHDPGSKLQLIAPINPFPAPHLITPETKYFSSLAMHGLRGDTVRKAFFCVGNSKTIPRGFEGGGVEKEN